MNLEGTSAIFASLNLMQRDPTCHRGGRDIHHTKVYAFIIETFRVLKTDEDFLFAGFLRLRFMSVSNLMITNYTYAFKQFVVCLIKIGTI